MALLGWLKQHHKHLQSILPHPRKQQGLLRERWGEVYYRMTHAICRKHGQMLFGWRLRLYLKSKFSLNGWRITCYYSCRGSEFSPQHHVQSSKSPVTSGWEIWHPLLVPTPTGTHKHVCNYTFKHTQKHRHYKVNLFKRSKFFKKKKAK